MRRRKDRGATLILLSLMMLLIIALAALVIDVNTAQRSQKRLQYIADMTAVSAGVMLPDQTDASLTATAIAKANGATSVNVTYPNPGEVRVSLQQANRYFFAPILGVNNKVVAAGATVVSRGGKIVPLSVLDGALTPGKQYTFVLKKLPGQTLTSGDFVALSIGGNGAGNYVNRLENSYGGDYTKGPNKDTETSASLEDDTMTGIVLDPATGNAIFQRAALPPWLDNGSTYSYPNYPEGNPRIVMLARVVQPAKAKGVSKVTINRFGSAYLRDYQLVPAKGKGKGGPPTGDLTLIWLGDFTATSGNPNRGWFQTKGLTRLSK